MSRQVGGSGRVVAVEWIEEEVPRGRGGVIKDSSLVVEESSSQVGGEIAAAEQNGLAMTGGRSGEVEERSRGALQSSLVVEESTEQSTVRDKLLGTTENAEGMEGVVVLMDANAIGVPDLGALVAEHEALGADLSVVVSNGPGAAGLGGDAGQIYIAGRGAIECVPAVGYCDIKEGLIPAMVRNGLKIRRILAEEWGSFGTWQEYMQQVLQQLARKPLAFSNKLLEERKTEIDETARIHGQVWIGCGACIEEDAVILGPAVIGRGCRVGRGAVVVESIMWEGSTVDAGAAITECLVDAGAVVGAGAEAIGRFVTGKLTARAGRTADGIEKEMEGEGQAVLKKTVQTAAARLAAAGGRVPARARRWAGAAATGVCFLWAYWDPTIVSLWKLWMRSDEFSSGLLVPFLAVYILWSRRHSLKGVAVKPAILWGLATFAAAQAMRFVGMWLGYGSAENLSLVLTVCALVLLLFGWRVVWRVWPVLAFLFLMLPLPNSVQAWITTPLQRWATSSAVFGLEALGFDVARHGNVIDINDRMVAVAEACNGLRMLTAFVVIAALVALVVERRWWEKAILMAASVPIAFACNTLRLIITAIAFTQLNTGEWEERFHDFGGLAMMPVALAMVMGLLWLMSKVVQCEEQEAVPQVQVVRKAFSD